MHSARSQESPLSQDQTIFGRHAGRLLGLVALVGALALGTLPVSAQTEVPETPPLPAATALGPRELVKSSLSRVLTIVESQSAKATEAGGRRAEIREAAVEMFDFDDMSRRILAQHWKDRSLREQEEFVRLFTDLLERVYLTSIVTYPLASITFQDESINGSYAKVQSRMTGGRGETLAIEYRLFKADGRWAVYDVAVDGISLISSFRSQANSILRRSPFAELLRQMQDRDASVAPSGQSSGR
jgi:phospholipid transport system substrate-binding protein